MGSVSCRHTLAENGVQGNGSGGPRTEVGETFILGRSVGSHGHDDAVDRPTGQCLLFCRVPIVLIFGEIVGALLTQVPKLGCGEGTVVLFKIPFGELGNRRFAAEAQCIANAAGAVCPEDFELLRIGIRCLIWVSRRYLLKSALLVRVVGDAIQ